jgi:DNA-binding response OmpR family regulator
MAEKGGPRLLVIEDDPDVRLFMVLALRSEGYDVFSAADAQQAIEQLGKTAFDIVLTDFGLPGKDGLMLLEEAERRGLLHNAKVVMLTAFPWLARNVNVPVLSKPVDLDDLSVRLRSMLGITDASTRAHP